MPYKSNHIMSINNDEFKYLVGISGGKDKKIRILLPACPTDAGNFHQSL